MLLREAKGRSLSKYVGIAKEWEVNLAKANKTYDVPNKGFEYFDLFDAVKGSSNVPSLPLLAAMCDAILTSTRDLCLRYEPS